MNTNLAQHRILSIDPALWRQTLARVEEANAQAGEGLASERADWLDELFPAPEEPSRAGGMAIIPIKGVLCPGLTPFERRLGLCDTDLVAQWVRAAAADPSAGGILLDIQSPGGAVAGIPECAGIIGAAAKAKPVCAFIRGVGASAAYWLASQANEIHTQPSAVVGSIGVYSVVYDTRKMFEAFGVQVQVFRSGKFKGAGIEGTSLTEEQAAQIQSQVDRLATLFRSEVHKGRHGTTDDAMQGQTFDGLQSLENGLADYLALDLTEVLATLES